MDTSPTSSSGRSAVLICEDDPVQGRVLQANLQQRGWAVIGPCPTPEESVRRAREEDLCAAILDVALDGGSAAETASILIERGIPFAFVTAYGPATAATLGTFSDRLVVPKPITPDLLDQIMASLLGDGGELAVAD